MVLVSLCLVSAAFAEPLVVPAYEVSFVDFVAPSWPEDDKSGARSCSADIDFDPEGAVSAIEVRGVACPDSYRDAARAAMEQWRIEPHRVEGVAVEVRVEANLTFKPAPKEPVFRRDVGIPEPETREWWRTGALPPEDPVPTSTAYDWGVLAAWPAVPPRYPRVARDRYLQGECFVRVYVDSDGRAYGAIVEDCPDVFVGSALAAAQRWRLPTPEKNGVPQRSSVLLRIEYDL